jgi:hypothetical protein
MLEEVHINPHTGMRVGVKPTTEFRGSEIEYDPWLRIPISKVKKYVDTMIKKCLVNDESIYTDISNSGASHINRLFFASMWSKCNNKHEIANSIIKKCTRNVNIMFTQFYAHRLFDIDYEKCQLMLNYSIDLCNNMPISWDKWLSSAYLFKAKYTQNKNEKIKWCGLTILTPREIATFSPHLKYWKLFRAAAWLVGNECNDINSIKAINRYVDINFDGYKEYRGQEISCYDTRNILNDRAKCLNLMTADHGHPYLGNP